MVEVDRQRAGGSHALVVGGGMAGLLAARVLTEHFERVTILERDRLPAGPESRAGVPQARHVHGMLMRGRLILERLFPGLDAELAAAGAPSVDWTTDCRLFSFGAWKLRISCGITTRSGSRDLLEWSVRRRLAASGRVRLVEACEVTGLLAADGHARVVGVRTRPRNHGGGGLAPTEDRFADLVVDASGRSSRAPEWLRALGYTPPRETTVNAFLGYTSRWYARPTALRADWKLLLVQATPPVGTRGGVVLPVEGDRWIVTLAGAARDYPPTDERAFLDFARSLPSPILAEAIEAAQPLSPIFGYRRTENRLRHCADLPRWPDGFVLIGDAVCAFNPVYGQGMAVCAQEVTVLGRSLRTQRQRRPRGDLTGLARRFHRELARTHAPAWMLATGEDFRYPTTQGGRPGTTTRLLHWYVDRLIRTATGSPAAHRAFLQVWHMLEPPSALFHPAVMAQVLLASGQRSSREAGLAPASSSPRAADR